jgi:ankyrin repeat protein
MNAFSDPESSLENWFKKERLYLAAMSGELDELKHLLKSDCAKLINTFDDTGATPLILAAGNGHVDAVRLLIEAGADVNAHDESKIGDTALGRIEILVQAGANPNIRGWMQLNALDRAKKRKKKEGLKVFDLLKAAARKFKD